MEAFRKEKKNKSKFELEKFKAIDLLFDIKMYNPTSAIHVIRLGRKHCVWKAAAIYQGNNTIAVYTYVKYGANESHIWCKDIWCRFIFDFSICLIALVEWKDAPEIFKVNANQVDFASADNDNSKNASSVYWLFV